MKQDIYFIFIQTISPEIAVAFAYQNLWKRSWQAYVTESSLFSNFTWGIYFAWMAQIAKTMEFVQMSYKKVLNV